MEKKYVDAFVKHLPLAVQQFQSSIRIVLYGMEDDELLMKLEVANSNEDKFNNLVRDCTKVMQYQAPTSTTYL